MRPIRRRESKAGGGRRSFGLKPIHEAGIRIVFGGHSCFTDVSVIKGGLWRVYLMQISTDYWS